MTIATLNLTTYSISFHSPDLFCDLENAMDDTFYRQA